MGVQNLWDILESCKKTIPLHHLQNKRLCIDLSCWMVQLHTVTKSRGCTKEKAYLRGLFHRLRALIALNCSLVFVADGSIPAIKLATYRRRLNLLNEVSQDGANLQNPGSLRRNMGSEFSRMVKEAKMLGLSLGIPCLNGLEEAEAQCALLNRESLCDGCFTSDSDIFLFGAKTVYRDICLGDGGYVVCYEMADIRRQLGFGRNSLIALALLLGSDYSQGIRGFGIESACRIVKVAGDDEILQRIASGGMPFLKKTKASKKQLQSELIDQENSFDVYEVHQENICDLLNPIKKAISVLEDAQGSIIVKGLSQATVKSVLEFQKLYRGCHSSCKPANKMGNDPSRRSHKGLIIHVTSPTENSKAPLIGKMNFLDLAGYEDARKKGNSGLSFAATSRTNKALYALHKVVRALNANNIYVPFRESKVTRMLQESLGGSIKVLIIACLKSFCQDSVYMAKLASESCPVQQFIGNSSRKLKSGTRHTTFSPCKNRLLQSKSISSQKIIRNRVHFLQRSANTSASAITGKKLFDDDDSQINQTKQESSTSTAESKVEYEVLEKESSVVAITNATKNEPEDAESSVVAITNATKNEPEDVDNLPLSARSLEELKVASENGLDKENYGMSVKEDGSPLLSVQLEELSNNLKKLYYSTPSVMVQHKNKLLCNDTLASEGFEPKTPTTNFEENERQNLSPIKSPLVASRTCYPETKKSLAQEYLRFINSASKEELKGLQGIGEKRASYILKLRELSPEPFKQLDDLKNVGLSAKQIKKMLAIK